MVDHCDVRGCSRSSTDKYRRVGVCWEDRQQEEGSDGESEASHDPKQKSYGMMASTQYIRKT